MALVNSGICAIRSLATVNGYANTTCAQRVLRYDRWRLLPILLLGYMAHNIPRPKRAVRVGHLLVLWNVGTGGGVMPGQIKQTFRIREHLDTVLQKSKSGDIIRSSKVAATLKENCRYVTVRNVGLALRERTDVELVESGVWRKL